ncbi:MAG TPA: amidohydrolase family protein [Planctomycetota bacterium]
MSRILWIGAAALAVGIGAPALIGSRGGDPPDRTAAADALRQAEVKVERAYHAARIWQEPGAAAPLVDAWLLVGDGKVQGVARSAADLPPLLPVIELGAAEIMPGLVAADSTVAGAGNAQGEASLGADRRAIDDFDAWRDLDSVLSKGITTFYLSPSRDRLVGGRGAVVKTAGGNRVLVDRGDLRVSLDPGVWGRAPRFFRMPLPPNSQQPYEPLKAQAPSSRAGALLALRESWYLTRYLDGSYDAHRAAFAEFLKGREPLRVVAANAGEVRAAIDLAAEWGRRLLLDGAAEAAPFAAALAKAGAGVIFQVPLFLGTPDLPEDWVRPEPGALAALHAQGLPVALAVGPFGRWTMLLEAAAAAAGDGLDQGAALAAVTRVPAQLLGVADRAGSLLAGRDADFVVMSGAPLDPASSVQRVYVEGELVWREQPRPDAAPASDAVIVRAGTLWTGSGAPLTGGWEVLLRNGRVEAVGRSVPHPRGARLVDAGAAAHLTPGFIDAGGRLGIGGGRVDPKALLGLLASGSRYRSDWAQVARAGVTTMALEPAAKPPNGAGGPAVKTAAEGGDGAWVQDHELVWFSVRGGDHLARANELAEALKRGKSYADSWAKYRKERAEWEVKHAEESGKAGADAEAALRVRLAQGTATEPEAPVAEVAEAEIVEEAKVKLVDPINGMWEATIEDERLPQPVSVQARMRHEGARLLIVLSSPEAPGENFEIEGTWDAATKIARVEVDTEIGKVVIVGELVGVDLMNVRVELAGLGSTEFEAHRTEVDAGGGEVAVTRKRRAKDDGPQPPKTDWNLEGQRALFEGRAVAIVEAERADEIRVAVEAFAAHELPVAILGGEDALQVADLLREKSRGVVLSSTVIERVDGRDHVPAAELLAAGIPVAFRSGAQGGARFLPEALALATRYGLGADQALQALTSGAAALLGLDEELGLLAPGRAGDVVVHSGPPFDLRSRVERVFVNGREVPKE